MYRKKHTVVLKKTLDVFEKTLDVFKNSSDVFLKTTVCLKVLSLLKCKSLRINLIVVRRCKQLRLDSQSDALVCNDDYYLINDW